MARTPGDSWWIDGGRETCGFCLQRYAYEQEYRCDECDGPMCPHCAAPEDSTVRCPECLQAALVPTK